MRQQGPPHARPASVCDLGGESPVWKLIVNLQIEGTFKRSLTSSKHLSCVLHIQGLPMPLDRQHEEH